MLACADFVSQLGLVGIAVLNRLVSLGSSMPAMLDLPLSGVNAWQAVTMSI